MLKKLLSFGLLFATFSSFAQTDTTSYASLADFLKKGRVKGSARAYLMLTDNQANLTDYVGSSFGAGIGYETPKFKGFSAGMSGYFITNIYSSDFSQVDSTTQNPNRYELGLFDVTDPANRNELSRLEELWVKFQFKKNSILWGKYKPDNLFINPQDGRMRPTMVQGLNANFTLKNNDFNFQGITHITPRSTVKWYPVAESIGIYPPGRNTDGTPSGYAGNVHKTAILIAEMTNHYQERLNTKIGTITVPGVFQTFYLNPEFHRYGWKFGVMAVHQRVSGNGGNDEPAKAYFPKNDKATVFSGQAGYHKAKHQWLLNYTRIADAGRFLMPREWGREPFYTFMPRERNEGLSDVNAFTANWNYTISKQLKTSVAYGRFYTPDASDFARNKYALPAYSQLNLQADYAFKNYLQGLNLRFLYVRKDALDRQLSNPKFIFNKVNMNLVNFILNYSF